MTAASLGTITEHSWRFAGYLQLPEEIDRARIEYLDALPGRLRSDPFVPHVEPPPPPPEEDDLGGRRIADPNLLDPTPLTDLADAIGRLRQLAGPSVSVPKPVFPPKERFPEVDEASGFDMGIRTRLINVTYSPGGDQQLLQVDQVNRLSDDDLFTNGSLEGWSIDWTLPPTHELGDLIRLADDVLPLEAARVTSANATDVMGLVRDEDLRIGSSTVSPGLHVNGELASDRPVMPTRPGDEADTGTKTATPGPLESVVTGPTGSSSIETGGNTQDNVIGLFDGNEATASLIVMGDVVRSDAIFQINVILDHDRVEGVGNDSDSKDALPTPENVLTNIAEFVDHIPTSAGRGAGGTPNWNVHVVDGDFLDVKMMRQSNVLDDNDRVVSEVEKVTYKYSTGSNEQGNAIIEMHDTSMYDIIVVMGSMYSFNWIFQKNILIDSDQLDIRFGGDDGPSSSAQAVVSAQDNVLWNDAEIERYGARDFTSVSDSERELVQALDQGDPTLTPENWRLQGDSDGTLDVLFVRGNYFDLNFLFQSNIMRDVDGIGAGGGQGSIMAGSNTLNNLARIIDVGTLTTSQFAHGSVYSESVLIQSNIIAGDDEVEFRDTTSLVPEVIAFLEATGHESQDDGAGASRPVPYDDVVGSILN